MTMNEEYSYAVCLGCGKTTWLKYGRCVDCNAKQTEVPDFIHNLFNTRSGN